MAFDILNPGNNGPLDGLTDGGLLDGLDEDIKLDPKSREKLVDELEEIKELGLLDGNASISIEDLDDDDSGFDASGKLVDLLEEVVGEDGALTKAVADQLIGELLKIGSGRKFGRGGKGDDDIQIAHDDGAIAFGGGGNDTILGGGGNDKLIGKFGSNDLDGGDGDDEVRGGDGNDRVRGGRGNDRGVGGDGDDDIDGGEGDDILRGDLGRDTINGGADNDRLFGFADEDSVMGGDGDDIVRGGLANDSLYGGSGKDIIRGGEDEDYIEGGTGNDKLYGGNGNDSILGEDGDDRLEGQSGRDTLDGGAGNDNLRGGSEDDLIFGGLGDDFVLGGTGDDVITGAEGKDSIHGESGADSISGGDGADRLFGGNGRDTVDGGIGDDVVNGGTEDDSLTGGEGNDTLGGASGDDIVDGGVGNDRVNGGSGDDSLIGGEGNDALDGGANADTIDGGNGDDSLTGGAGNDSMIGGAGHDLFVSDAGDDTMTGGEGSEWYYYENEQFGHDLITDFEAVNGDLLDLSRTGFTRADLDVQQITEDMITIHVPGNRSITLHGVSKFDINTEALYFGDGDGAVELQDFIINGSFENVTETGRVLDAFNGNGNGVHDTTEVVWYETVEGWASDDGRIEVKGEKASGAFAIDAADGQFYAELDDGSSRAQHENNEMHQDVKGLVAGRSYELSFDFANRTGDADGHVDVFFGGEKVGTVSSNAGNFATKTFDLIGGSGDGSDRLSFSTPNSGNEAGAFIDNVKLVGYVQTDGALTPVGEDNGGGDNGGGDNGGGDNGGGDNGGGGDTGGQQEFIVNGSFENVTTTGTKLGQFGGNRDNIHDTNEVVWYETVEGWSSQDGRIEVKGEDASGAFAIDASDGDYYIELDDGSRRAQFENNEIRQDVQGLEAGETYTLTFDSANNAGNSAGHIDVFFGGQKIGSVTSNSGSFQENTFDVTGGMGNGSDRLSFVTSNSRSEAGAFIDNVSLKGATPVAQDDGDATPPADPPAGPPANDPKPEGQTLTGGSGKDTLTGGDGDDTLDGGKKSDQLFGGAGDDSLIGGKGGDALTGGAGADTFVIDTERFGNDTILDFNASEGDVLDFTRIAAELSDLTVFQSGGDTMVQVRNGGSIELEGVNASSLNSDEVFLFG